MCSSCEAALSTSRAVIPSPGSAHSEAARNTLNAPLSGTHRLRLQLLWLPLAARIGGLEGDERGSEDEDAANQQRPLEAARERVRRRGVGGEQMLRTARGEGGEDRQPERSAELLRRVEQRGG